MLYTNTRLSLEIIYTLLLIQLAVKVKGFQETTIRLIFMKDVCVPRIMLLLYRATI